jgi:tetratricopeptide (TPR) repeat protein
VPRLEEGLARPALQVQNPAVRIGEYEILGEVGRGGMGVVYRARSTEGRDVAVKLLLGLQREKLARFDRERRILAALGEADGFVPLLAAGDSGEGPYLVMPFMPGGTLRKKLESGPLKIEETIELGQALARSLARAHERGIVHRDLKPENVLFDGRRRALLGDLGLSKHFRDAPGASRSIAVSRTGEILGTVGYMAPEQMHDATRAGAEADVFSLGAILHECLAGEPAFAAESLVELASKVDLGHVTPLSRLRPETPRWLQRTIARALDPDPRRRHADGSAFLRALESRSPGARPRVIAIALLALLGVAAASGLSFRARWRRTQAEVAVAEGRRLERSKKPDEALAEYARALELDPEHVAGTYTGRASVLCGKGEYREALEWAEKAIAADPSLSRAWLTRGMARFFLGDRKNALADYSRAIELDPKNARALGSRAGALVDMGDVTQALRDGDAALAIEPDLDVALANRGAARARAGDLKGAAADFARELALDPANVEAAQNLAAAYEMQGDHARAVEALTKALAVKPGTASLLATRALVRANAGDKEGARADLDQAVAADPRSALAWESRGQLLATQGQDEAAIADYTRALEISPRLVQALRDRSGALQRKGDLDGAIADDTRAIELEPGYALTWEDRGSIRGRKGDLEGEIDDCTRALALDARRKVALVNRSSALTALGRLGSALADAERAVEIDPRFGAAWFNLGFVHERQGERDKAISDYSRAVEVEPTHAKAWCNLAVLKGAAGDYDGEIEASTRALESEPRQIESLVNRAVARSVKKDMTGARTDLDKALGIDPAFPKAWYARGRLLDELGDRDGAIRDYERFLALAPREEPLIPEAQGALARLRNKK